jgi:hypothetical protein
VSVRPDASGQCPVLSVSVRLNRIRLADRRAAAARQAAYRKRRRLGLVMLTFEVSQADLTAEGLHRQLLGSAGATRKDLERVGEVILQEAMIGKRVTRQPENDPGAAALPSR